MRHSSSLLARSLFLMALPFLSIGSADAHMPWLSTDEQGHAILWFGESPADRTYHMPEAVASVEIRQGDEEPLTMVPVDSEELVGLRSDKPVGDRGELHATVTYGLYHGTRLTYHIEHLPQESPRKWPAQRRKNSEMQTVIRPMDDGGLSVTVLRRGEALPNAEVDLFCSDGHKEGSATSDPKGHVTFSANEVEDGLNAVLVGYTDERASGDYQGNPYSSTSDYLTATFFSGDDSSDGTNEARSTDDSGKQSAKGNANVQPANLPDLPEELTSFGAALLGRTVYVYGGHTGTAHSYSTEEQSNRLWSLDLDSAADGSWKKVTTGPKLQGLALEAHGERVIRIGGFTALNAPNEEQDLSSQASVAAYDTATGQWIDLPMLPEPRSSFDAAILNDTVYVCGGWNLQSDSDDSQWHTTAWSLDLADQDARWQPLAEMPAKRRACSVTALRGKIYVIGGMQDQGGPTTDVLVYDLASGTWSEGPALPGEGMAGFGNASCAIDDDLYVSSYDGNVYRLSDDETKWQAIAKIEPTRFFHQMLPVANNQLLTLGGVNMEAGKFTQPLAVELR